MPQFPVHTLESAPPASRPALGGLQKEVGFLPNLAATMSESPALIEGFTTLRTILGRSLFSPLERETIALSVSFENTCSYCMAAHSTFAKMQGVSEGVLESLRLGETPDDQRLAALATYTRALVTSKGHVSDAAKQAVLAAGFTPAHVLEVVAVIAFTTMANYAHNITQCPIDRPFQPQAWTMPIVTRSA
jgi:uncharacterized peroxidase-related enzyme